MIVMLRLFSGRGSQELWRCSHLLASRKIARCLPVNSACPLRLHGILPRHFTTGSPAWEDALQPKEDKSAEVQTVDLDKWKSVMKSQAAFEGKQQAIDDEEAESDDGGQEPRGDLKGSSVLEATRDLVAMWRQAGKHVPQEMSDEEVQILANLTSKSSRKKYLKFLASKEAFKRARKEKQKQKKEERLALMEQSMEQDQQSGLKNTLFLKYWDQSLDKILAWRSAQAMVFGQPLVFDMSYDSNMSRREMENTVSQLMDVEGCNRRATEPFHLHFCNVQPGGLYKQQLLRRYGQNAWDNLLITSTDRQHVDMFPHEQLVYLTADSPNVLRTFDHSKVYIIGAMVDLSIHSGLSLANAKRLKLATARLPLDELLQWDVGAKNLTLDQMIRIMITLKETGNWEEALKFVPMRKHGGLRTQQTKSDNAGVPHARVPHAGVPHARVPHARVPHTGVPHARVPHAGVPHAGVPHAGVPHAGVPHARVPHAGVPHAGVPHAGVPHARVPHSVSGLNHRPREDGDRWLRSGERTVKSQYKSNKQFGTGRKAGLPSDGDQPSITRVRTSFKNSMESRKGAGKSKMYWNDV